MKLKTVLLVCTANLAHLMSLLTVSTAYLQSANRLRFPHVKVEALKFAQTTSYFASMLLVSHCLLSVQEAVLPLSSIMLLLSRATL